MKLVVLALSLLLSQIPKHDPNGIWEAATGSQFDIRLTGSNLHVKLVPGSNPKFLQYEVDMKNQDEVNTYKGTGSFVAKMESGKECKFETEWQFVVVSPERIIGASTNITADKNTCEIRRKDQTQLELKKTKR